MQTKQVVMGWPKSLHGKILIMVAIIAAVLLAGFSSCSADITPSTPSASPRKPRFWPWREPSAVDSPSATTTSSSIHGEDRSSPSSTILPVYGNVYPHGFYYVMIYIGEPPRPYFLDVDSGSDVTWVQCDAPCVSCAQGPHPLYRPAKNRLIPCDDPLCTALHQSTNHEGGCDEPRQCDYEIEYQDQGSSIGVLVADAFALRLTNTSLVKPIITFGCGYDQQAGISAEPNGRSATDGVLGLGNGKVGILSQLRELGVCKSVVGHCLSRQGAGFLFFGEDVVPPRSVKWAAMTRVTAQKYYSPGVASIYAGKLLLGVNQPVVLDSGSSYSYFTDQIYQPLLAAVKADALKMKLKEATADKTLPRCWKGTRPFKNVLDLRKYFRPLYLSIRKSNTASVFQMEIPPENYFIITKQGNACLGILNADEIGLVNLNVIGDISMQDVMVVYDNERQRIGWARVAGCSHLPKPGNTLH